MPRIFICYRREDSRWPAHWIYNDLVDHFGSESVVFDIDTIPLGVDFREYLNKEVSRCDIFLAVMGDRWLEILKQRLEQPNDFVRIEIQAALERRIPVVPILVGEKPVPSEKELPPELTDLSYKQAAEVRAGADLQSHRKRLVDGLDRLFSEKKVGKDLKQRKVDEEIKREEPPKTYTNSIGMEFVLIPAGRFQMGSGISPEEVIRRYGGKEEWLIGELHRHQVSIKSSFYLQSTPVTQGQWQRLMRYNPSYFRNCGDSFPVENVSWDMSHEFIRKLNEKEGSGNYRLPSVAEWEYACRAGTNTEFLFGDDVRDLSDYAWYRDNADCQTHAVAQKKANDWGLFDMQGNVWDWVEDDWHESYEIAPDDGSAWVDENRNTYRVIRGGSWDSGAQNCRSAARSRSGSGYRITSIGFRLARSVNLLPKGRRSGDAD